MSRKLRISLLALGLIAAAPSYAALITSRGALGGTDFIDWGTLGPANTVLTSGTAPHPVTSNGGRSATVTDADGILQRLDQSSPNPWNGNFAPGDRLIWTQVPDQNVFPGPMVIDFVNPVFGAGAQIMADVFGTFTGIITAFNAANVILETYSVGGNAGGTNDNTAIFLGIRRATADIDHISFDVRNAGGGALPAQNQDFAINRFDIVGAGGTTGVPEPATLALLGLGLAGLGFSRRKARSN